jgi:hypothetical protein
MGDSRLQEAIASNRPVVAHALASRIWSLRDRGLLSRELFIVLLDDVRQVLAEVVPRLDRWDLAGLFADYLRTGGCHVQGADTTTDGIVLLRYTLQTPFGRTLAFCGAGVSAWDDGVLLALRQAAPTAVGFHVLCPAITEESNSGDVEKLGMPTLMQFASVAVLEDFFYDTYLNSILAMEGFRAFMRAALLSQAGLTEERRAEIARGWGALRGRIGS